MDTPNTFPGMFWGYLVVWGLLSAYILSLGARVRRLEKKDEDSPTS